MKGKLILVISILAAAILIGFAEGGDATRFHAAAEPEDAEAAAPELVASGYVTKHGLCVACYGVEAVSFDGGICTIELAEPLAQWSTPIVTVTPQAPGAGDRVAVSAADEFAIEIRTADEHSRPANVNFFFTAFSWR